MEAVSEALTAKVKAAVRTAAATAEMVAALVEAKVMKAARETATEAVVSEAVTGTDTAPETEAEMVAVESTVKCDEVRGGPEAGWFDPNGAECASGTSAMWLLMRLAEPVKDRAGPEEVEVKCEVVLKEQH